MNSLSLERRAVILKALVDGNAIRSTVRMTGASKATVLKLLVEVGEFCSVYQNHVLTELPCRRIEADESWSFVGAKQKSATRDGQGDIWTFTAICADTKLMVSWLVGDRSAASAHAFLNDVASRLRLRVQITTGGHHMYLSTVEKPFGYNGADFAQLVKTYGARLEVGPGRKYSPMQCTGAEKRPVFGNPDMSKISTSYVERASLSMRMGMLRFTRLTNGFSKQAENHAHAVSLNFFYYNFCRAHQTLTKAAGGIKTTPAMAAEVTSRVWTIENLLEIMDPNFLLHSN